jgi:hypothetical protein
MNIHSPFSAFILLFLGCNAVVDPDKPTDDSPPDDPDAEVCDNGEDDDEDGATDCDDSDCDNVAPCNWPSNLDHMTQLDFQGNTIECKLAGFPIPYDVEDCLTEWTASLTHIEMHACDSCDRVYNGPITLLRDECSELIGNTEPIPSSMDVGMVFISETQREVWGINEAGVWEKSADLTYNAPSWVASGTAEIREDISECNNGVQHLGDLTVSVTFTDTP